LKGCTFPVVLRREGRASYIVVGACYLAGFMFGEFYDEGWREGRKLLRFVRAHERLVLVFLGTGT